MKNVIVERETMLKLRKQLPARIDYATLVLEKLHQVGVFGYDKNKIYGMVSGRQKPKEEVLNALIAVVTDISKKTIRIIIE